MSPKPLKIVYLTAGAGGMFCGSCLSDNTLARALIELGHDVQLIPLYTPIRTEGENVAQPRVFFGGINMYLQQKLPLFRALPAWLDRAFDQPWLIRLATSFGIKTTAKDLGALAVSVLRGHAGFQTKEVDRLVDWLAQETDPDLINFSNILTAGCIPELRRKLGPRVKILVTLQGDDIFLRDLPEPYQGQALAEVRRLVEQIDGFLVHSRFYAEFMAGYLGIPREKFRVIPLGIDMRDLPPSSTGEPATGDSRQLTIGYLARLAPEKGLHVLADAFIELKKLPGMDAARLRIAGWLGPQHQQYAQAIFAKLKTAGLSASVEHVGEVDRRQKLQFLQSLDLLSVPTTYHEPKGLFVLESLAAGVPVVAPDHGSFPETLAELGGGLLHRPSDAPHLAETIHQLLLHPAQRTDLAAQGQAAVLSRRTSRAAAQAMVDVARGFLNP